MFSMKLDFDNSSLLQSVRQTTDASAQAAQHMREQFQQTSAEIQKITAATVHDQSQQWNTVSRP